MNHREGGSRYPVLYRKRDSSVYAGYCWIVQSELQSSLVDWIVIDNPKSKLDFDFITKHGCLTLVTINLFQNSWITIAFGLDCQSHFCDGFGLD